MNTQNLIISLIKDDLIHIKLVLGLNEMGLNAGDYFLNLSSTVFKLIGFEDNAKTEEVFERYMELTQRTRFIDISQSHKPIEDLAMVIYTEMLSLKPSNTH
ncbi:MAG: hypothetical protein V4651_11515 [Bacteroidota bacterium]